MAELPLPQSRGFKDEKNRELTNLTHEETGVVSPNASLEEDPEPAINLEDPRPQLLYILELEAFYSDGYCLYQSR